MKVHLLLLLFFITTIYSFSFDIGGALSIDYYNNPIENSAPSPIQQRPIVFHSMNLGLFNLRSGFGVTEAYYEINEEGLTVFNDMYKGFYTLEFDLFVYPGILFKLTESFRLGIAGGGGVRLPVLVKVDADIPDDMDIDAAFNAFYSDYHYLYWGAQLFTTIRLPLSQHIQFFGTVHYRDFVQRENEWIIGATAGLLWQFV